jgi:hypothetical protein
MLAIEPLPRGIVQDRASLERSPRGLEVPERHDRIQPVEMISQPAVVQRDPASTGWPPLPSRLFPAVRHARATIGAAFMSTRVAEARHFGKDGSRRRHARASF